MADAKVWGSKKEKKKREDQKWEDEILLPNGTHLIFKKVKGRGIHFKFLNDQKLKIRNRQGGEFFKPDSKRPTKKIKQLLQESDLPPWEREFFPIIFVGEDLASVPNFGVDIKFQTKSKEVGLQVIL